MLLGLALTTILVLLAFFQLRQRYLSKETQRLKEMDEFKTRLYTNITHEFRTPLTVILGMSEQIRTAPKEWLNMGLENIERNGKQLLQLINQLLDLSKLDAGSYDLKLKQQDIPSFLHYLFTSIHPLMESKNISSSITCNFAHPVAQFDTDKVEKVVLNLLSNAAKYTPENGRIELISEEMDSQLYLSIFNSGEGIPKDQLPYIFDRFYQAETAETGGTGIGLALVKELVEVMNGKIEVQSKVGIGTTFQLWIPMEFVAKNAEKTSINTPTTNKVQNLSLPPKNDLDAPLLLLVEDHPDVSNYLKELLKKDYRIQTASNGEEGLALALKNIPDLIISDVMMPKMDGFALCEQLKKDVRTSHIPIVLLTAKADDLSRLEGLEYGADAYLTKPFNKLELEIRLRKLLELRQQLQAKYSDPNFILTKEKNHNNLEVKFLQKVQGIIIDNLANEDFKVEPHLCRAMTMSRPQLYRKLKALKNCSPSDLIKHLRMQEAQRLLAQRQLSISEIAEQVGFKNPSYFTKVYSDTFGEAPSQAAKRF
ncbi:MAG: ATP-binding protein [Bacteroidota bacterium]